MRDRGRAGAEVELHQLDGLPRLGWGHLVERLDALLDRPGIDDRQHEGDLRVEHLPGVGEWRKYVFGHLGPPCGRRISYHGGSALSQLGLFVAASASAAPGRCDDR
jgi:hypothetical protein